MKNLVTNRMDFESPDVEKDFPGLYASESARKSNESDFSDDGHDRPSKKDLLIGKRKDKKDSKKDRGYAALEGESSPEEDPETKSPSKSKKSKSFKFPSKKEKREKSREKDGKEKDNEKEKKKDKDIKAKLKLKERKKSKHLDDGPVFSEDLPVFGVPLNVATERSHCHDGVYIPMVVRDCIDYVQECGLNMESIYKLSGIKSKVQNLRRMYNQRESVNLSDYEPPVVTSLLKLFFRELPEPLLTNELLPVFEDVAGGIDAAAREAELLKLVNLLPKCNRHLLAWLIVHFDNIVFHEKHNKMSIQALTVTLNPILQMSHRLLSTLISHSKSLFPDVKLRKYVPPLSAGSPLLPDTTSAICEELGKQESLLSQIHQEMNAGFVSKRNEEQLWEVQRLITQLKRKLRTVQKTEESFRNQKSLDDKQVAEDEFQVDLALQKPLSCSEDETGIGMRETHTTVLTKNNSSPVAEQVIENNVESSVPEADLERVSSEDMTRIQDQVDGLPTLGIGSQSSTEGLLESENQQFIEDNAVGLPIEGEEEMQGLLQEEIILQLESRELLNLQADLQGRVQGEKEEIERLRQELAAAHNKYNYRNLKTGSSDGSNSTSQSDNSDTEDLEIESRVSELQKENIFLQQKKSNLIQRIIEERRACLNLRVQISLLQLTPESKQL